MKYRNIDLNVISDVYCIYLYICLELFLLQYNTAECNTE